MSKEKKMKKFYTTLVIIYFLSDILCAKTVNSNATKIELINIVNQQQVLSQRITKAYLYTGKKIAVDKANKQLKSALKSFYKTYSTINTSTKSPEIRNIMSFIKKSSSEFNRLANQPHNKKNAKLILQLSEIVLAKSKSVAVLLKKDLKKEAYESISKSGQQQVLVEKIAKYYIAYQSNTNDTSLKNKIKSSVDRFAKNHQNLMKNKHNSKIITQKLKEVDALWKVAYPLYKGMKLSSIVFNSTNKISKKMKEVTRLYMTMNK